MMRRWRWRHQRDEQLQAIPVIIFIAQITKLEFSTPLPLQKLVPLGLGPGLMKDIGELSPIPLPHEPKEAVAPEIPLG